MQTLDPISAPGPGSSAGPDPRPDSRPARAVDALVAARLLDPARRGEALDVVLRGWGGPAGPVSPPPMAGATPPASPPGGLPALVEVLAYLGGALVLAAGSLFGASYWDGLSFATRVGLLVVMVVALGVGGLAATRGHLSESRRRLASTLLTGTAVAAAGLTGMLVDRVLPSPQWDEGGLDLPLVGAAAVGLAVALGGRRLVDSAVGSLGAFCAATALVTAVVAPYDGDAGLGLTAATGLLAVAWLLVTERRLDRRTASVDRVLGVGLVLWAAQWPVLAGEVAWVGYLLTAVVAVVGVTLYLRLAAWPYLAVAVVAVTVVVPEAVADWTDGGLGAIGGVLLTGVTLLVAAGVAAHLRSRTLT